MAVSERWESYEAHETAAGTTISRVFDMLWTDWDEGIFDFHIGDALDTSRVDMRISDITITAISNTNCRAHVLYSTDIKIAGQIGNADQKASWESRLDIRTVEEPVIEYTKYTDPQKTASTTETWDKANPLYIFKKSMSFHITMYGSNLYIKRVTDNINKINSEKFLQALYGKQELNDDTDAKLTDIGKWLFVGCPIITIRYNVFRYEFTFVYKDDGWNTQDGVTVNIYRTADMQKLFKGMDKTDSISNQETGRPS